jgi:hypothetical protein
MAEVSESPCGATHPCHDGLQRSPEGTYSPPFLSSTSLSPSPTPSKGASTTNTSIGPPSAAASTPLLPLLALLPLLLLPPLLLLLPLVLLLLLTPPLLLPLHIAHKFGSFNRLFICSRKSKLSHQVTLTDFALEKKYQYAWTASLQLSTSQLITRTHKHTPVLSLASLSSCSRFLFPSIHRPSTPRSLSPVQTTGKRR